MSAPLLVTRNLTKRFGGVTALKSVNFELGKGEVHSLCGENGAGKSTLIKLLGGLHPYGSYEGEISMEGRPAQFLAPGDSSASGIAVIYQELALVPEMTVAENLLLGNAPKRGGLIDWNALYQRAKEILAEAKIDLDPVTPIGELGVGQRQLVEIARAIGKKSKILILDEPTAALTDQEVIALLELVKRYRADGISCIYISHKLDEVFAISDRITVLRDGQSIITLDAKQTNEKEVIRHMVGREITDLFPRRAVTAGDVKLEVKNLSVAPRKGAPAFLKDLSFEVRAGEVLGIGGLMGAGRSELLMHLFGAWGERKSGQVRLLGRELSPRMTPQQVLQAGMALVSEDRKRFGLILGASIGYHLTLSSLDSVTSNGLIDAPRENTISQQLFNELRIKAPDLETPVGSLSGGNQQKVVLGKALNTKPKLLMLDEPTRGIDVGAKLEVYNIVNRISSEGTAVILVSSELPELIGMSDRIIMLHEGQASGPFMPNEVTQERLLAAALGKLKVKSPAEAAL
jgi:D-xylose transport system ATP-binding protein